MSALGGGVLVTFLFLCTSDNFYNIRKVRSYIVAILGINSPPQVDIAVVDLIVYLISD